MKLQGDGKHNLLVYQFRFFTYAQLIHARRMRECRHLIEISTYTHPEALLRRSLVCSQ